MLRNVLALSALGVAVAKDSPASGLSIQRNNSFVALGEKADVVLSRNDKADLLVKASSVSFDAPVAIEDLYVLNGADEVVSLQEYFENDPREAGTWNRAYTFGANEDGICDYDAAIAAGLDFDGTLPDDYCQGDYFGLWCASGCTGTVIVPLDYDDSNYVRVKLGVSYDNDSCQGYLYHVDGETDESTLLWTHEKGGQEDAFEMVVPFNTGDSLEVVETGTCIVDLYHIDVFKQNVEARITELEERVAYLEEKLFNHTVTLGELGKTCEWERVNTFGEGNICSTAAMSAAGWTLSGINDDRCNTDNYGAWCGGTCTGYMSYALPDGYSAGRLTMGHSYGGSCQGFVTLYHADDAESQTSLFTHEAGETFDPERITFEIHESGTVLEVIETQTCIMDLYALDLLPTSC